MDWNQKIMVMKTKIKNNKKEYKELSKKVMEIIPYYNSLAIDRERKQVQIEYDNNGVTFDQLEKLSILFKSKDINFVGSTKEIGYSEVTFDTEIEGSIFISNAVLEDE